MNFQTIFGLLLIVVIAGYLFWPKERTTIDGVLVKFKKLTSELENAVEHHTIQKDIAEAVVRAETAAKDKAVQVYNNFKKLIGE